VTATPASSATAAATATGDDRHRSSTVVVIVGWCALIAIAIAAGVALVPVRNGPIQACGAPGAFLLEGRTDLYPDADGRVRRSNGEVEQLSPAEIADAYDRPCSQRVADRMVPAGVLLTAGAVTGLIIVTAAAVGTWRSGRRRAAPAPTPEEGGEGARPSP